MMINLTSQVIKKTIFSFLAVVSMKANSQLPLRLPSILSDHAVLQESSDVRLWGWGPGSFKVGIVCSWNQTDTTSVTIKADCMWETVVKTPKAGGPYTIQFICGKQKIKLSDILTGEVWLCSGQSNMEFNFHWGVSDAYDALNTSANKEIRFFEINDSYDKYPQSDCRGQWKVCDSATASDFSAIGYFFGRDVNGHLKVPVGLIGSYWGGTGAQAWTPGEVFDSDKSLKTMTINIEPYGWAPKGASLLYNAMINPITPYRIAGVIWYQGEANVSEEPSEYGRLFSTMIQSWRKAFGTDVPFYYVQIAPWNGYAGIKGALLREQQQSALSLPHTGMVSVADLVRDVSNIHPKAKREVANRLANLVLKEQYGNTALQPYFPHFLNCFFHKNQAIVRFSSVGILSSRGQDIKNFQVAGADGKFFPAEVKIEKNGEARLTSDMVPYPAMVRYCFRNDDIPNLFDVNGLPLLPFRTDSGT